MISRDENGRYIAVSAGVEGPPPVNQVDYQAIMNEEVSPIKIEENPEEPVNVSVEASSPVEA